MELVKAEIPVKFLKFIKMCEELQYATIESLQIQDGLPVFVETEEGAIVITGAKIKKKHRL